MTKTCIILLMVFVGATWCATTYGATNTVGVSTSSNDTHGTASAPEHVEEGLQRIEAKYNDIERYIQRSTTIGRDEREALLRELHTYKKFVNKGEMSMVDVDFDDLLNRMIIFREKVATIDRGGYELVTNPEQALSALKKARKIRMEGFYSYISAETGEWVEVDVHECIQDQATIGKINYVLSDVEFALDEDLSRCFREDSGGLGYCGDHMTIVVDDKHALQLITFELMMCRYQYVYEAREASLVKLIILAITPEYWDHYLSERAKRDQRKLH